MTGAPDAVDRADDEAVEESDDVEAELTIPLLKFAGSMALRVSPLWWEELLKE
jgi:hypothetical protein